MGREIRKVPKDWKHPKNESDYHIPLHDSSYKKELAEYIEEEERFDAIGPSIAWDEEGDVTWRGKRYKTYPEEKGTRFETWHGRRPDKEDYRPDWKPEEMTHYQLYENVSEGTPNSPVFASLDQLEDWMVANGDPVHGAISRRAAKAFCKSGYAPSMEFHPGRGLIGGIQAQEFVVEKKNDG